MTFSNQTNRTSVVGDGSTGQEVPFLFPISATSDLLVKKRVTVTGVETLLAETTNYTVEINGDIGGTLTTVTTIETTETIHIIRNTPNTQLLDLEQGSSFNAENIEDALDKNTKLSIENVDAFGRTLVFPTTDPTSSFADMPNSINRASKNFTFDSDGKPTASVVVEEGDVTFTDFGTSIAEAADADTARGLIGLDTDDDVEFAEITSTDIITKGPWVDIRAHLPDGYVTDGSVDYSTELQAALDSLTSGGTLLVPITIGIGTGGWTGITLTSKTNITITSLGTKGGFKILVAPSQYLTAMSDFKQVFKFDQCTDIKIEGLTVNLNSLVATGGFGLDHSTRVVVRDNYIYGGADSNSNGVTSVAGNSNQYLNNYITGGGRGFWVGSTETDDYDIFPTIRGNRCISTGATGIGGCAQRGVITNNICDGTSGSGIVVAIVTTESTENTVISNNVCRGNAFQGIQLDYTSGDTRDVILSNNICYENDAHGIYIEHLTDSVINGNICYDNGQDSVAAGIYAQLSQRLTISNNQCYNKTGLNQDYGIWLVASENPDLDDCIISNNLCYNNAIHGIEGTRVVGTQLTKRVVFSGNICRNNGSRGLYTQETWTNCVFTGNICTGNTIKDVELEGGGYVDNYWETQADFAALSRTNAFPEMVFYESNFVSYENEVLTYY